LIITHEEDGLILDDPKDATGLATMIRRLCNDKAFRDALGERAAQRARQFTWERNGEELMAIFQEILDRKTKIGGQAELSTHKTTR
jgi:glycosyltransferase involved in cell wall biosynthesis